VVKRAALIVAVGMRLGPRKARDESIDALNQGAPTVPPRLTRPSRKSQSGPIQAREFDLMVTNDDVEASGREPRWNGKRRVGACGC
jgi:hypothetical protein